MRVKFPRVATATTQQDPCPHHPHAPQSSSRRLVPASAYVSYLFWPKSRVAQVDISVFSPQWWFIMVRFIYEGGQHYRTPSVDQCLRAQTWTPSSSCRSNEVHFTKWNTLCRILLDVLFAAAGRQATRTNYDKSILICRKGQFLKLAASRHSRAVEQQRKDANSEAEEESGLCDVKGEQKRSAWWRAQSVKMSKQIKFRLKCLIQYQYE